VKSVVVFLFPCELCVLCGKKTVRSGRYRPVIYLDVIYQAGPETAGAVMGNPHLCLIELSLCNRTNLRDLFEPVLRHKNNIPDIHCPIAFLGRRNVGR